MLRLIGVRTTILSFILVVALSFALSSFASAEVGASCLSTADCAANEVCVGESAADFDAGWYRIEIPSACAESGDACGCTVMVIGTTDEGQFADWSTRSNLCSYPYNQNFRIGEEQSFARDFFTPFLLAELRNDGCKPMVNPFSVEEEDLFEANPGIDPIFDEPFVINFCSLYFDTPLIGAVPIAEDIRTVCVLDSSAPSQPTPDPDLENLPFSVPGTDRLTSDGVGSVRTLIANVIQTGLGVMGTIALVMIIAGGLMYMTAGGNPQRTRTAQNVLVWAGIGMFAILASYFLVDFVFEAFRP